MDLRWQNWWSLAEPATMCVKTCVVVAITNGGHPDGCHYKWQPKVTRESAVCNIQKCSMIWLPCFMRKFFGFSVRDGWALAAWMEDYRGSSSLHGLSRPLSVCVHSSQSRGCHWSGHCLAKCVAFSLACAMSAYFGRRLLWWPTPCLRWGTFPTDLVRQLQNNEHWLISSR